MAKTIHVVGPAFSRIAHAGDHCAHSVAAERIIEAACTHVGGEITVMEPRSGFDLFRVGVHDGPQGVHIHDLHWDSEKSRLGPNKDSVRVLEHKEHKYFVDTLLRALASGNYKVNERC